jgi:hypothetical protein
MRRFLFFILVLFSLGACSVEDQELEDSAIFTQELNATYESGDCVVTTFDFSTLGYLEIRNDRDSIYVSVYATGQNDLSAISFDIANNFSGFPIVGKGNLQSNRMEYQESFGVGLNQHSYRFSLNDFNESVVIACYATFNTSESHWVGDIEVKQGNWKYVEYQIKEHPVNAGPDNSRTMTESAATALPSWDEVRKVYAGMLAPGVDRSSGTYSPSIWAIINDFNDPNRESKLGEYSTIYTLGSGDCTDSVELTLTVEADEAAGEGFF